MGQRLIVILVLLLMVRPIALVNNPACGEETAAVTSTAQTVPAPIPNPEIPCSDIVETPEIAGNNHHCPCFALIQPELAGITTTSDFFSLFARDSRLVETAVAIPPTPPPRLI